MQKLLYRCLFTAVLLAAHPALAQTSYGLVKGKAEVTGFGGFVAGVGTHGTVGGSAGVPLSERLFVHGELSYIPLSSRVTGLNFNAGAHYAFDNVAQNPRIVPYLGGGLGFLRTSADIGPIDASDTSFYVNFGGGARYYVDDRWGFRPELMIFAGDETYVRIAIGVFFQFGR
jgi:hypothetical protein